MQIRRENSFSMSLFNLFPQQREIQLPFNFAPLLLLLPIVFLLINIWRKSKLPKKYKNLPPTPPKLPMIGHLHHLVCGLPHRVLARVAQKYGPVFHMQLGEVLVVVIASREAAKEVLCVQDPACANRPETLGGLIMGYNYSDIALSPYNEYWRQMRKICILELLSTKNVKSFKFIRRDEASRLIKSICSSSGASINLTEKLFMLSISTVCRAAFGGVRTDYDKLIRLMKMAHDLAGGFELANLFPSSKLLNILCWNRHKLLWTHHELDIILDNIVEEHELKQKGEFGREDLVDVLLRLKNKGELKFPITKDNIKAIIFDMFSGGTETSYVTIDWAMAELMRNPHVMAKVQTEVRHAIERKKTLQDNDIQGLKYLKLVIKETLRLHPPFPLVPRACRDECTANGYLIPLKSNVLVNIWSIGRNPEYWHQPEAFQPERFINSYIDFLGNNFEFIPFGSGRRICPGMQFGLANIQLSLALLLYHFNWKIPDGLSVDNIDMTETKGLAAPRKNDLFLVPTIYNAPN